MYPFDILVCDVYVVSVVKFAFSQPIAVTAQKFSVNNGVAYPALERDEPGLIASIATNTFSHILTDVGIPILKNALQFPRNLESSSA